MWGTMNTNDELPDDPFGGEGERSIEDLIREDQELADAEDAILDDEKKAGRTKKIVAACTGVVVLGVVITAAFMYNPFGGSQTVGEKDPSTISNSSDNGGEANGPVDPNDPYEGNNISEEEQDKIAPTVKDEETFYQAEGNEFPVETEEWQQDVYDPSVLSEARGPILDSTNGSGLKDDSGILPYEAAGYTSDDSKQRLEDGSINPSYSFWTAESFTAEVAVMQERLLNPTFGGWGLVQYPAYPGNISYNSDILGDMFTPEFENRNADKQFSEYMPIYADWNGDNYGGNDSLLETGPRWYGEITNSSYEFVWNDSENAYDVNVTADVKFTAWAKNQSKLEKNGRLTLKLVANTEDTQDTGHKVLIDDASLKVE